MRKMIAVLAVVLVAVFCMPVSADNPLQVNVSVSNVVKSNTVRMPFITWGADIVTFYANGGLETTPDSIYGQLGLSIKLVPGDDMKAQLKEYLTGTSPFFRGTVGMIADVSEQIAKDARTKGQSLIQLSWSAGDHCVVRENIKTISDLKGKKVCLQIPGPHEIGLLDVLLKTANLSWNDIVIVPAPDLTGAKGPAEMFKKDASISACFVISPDMNGLTGGLHKVGDGRETVKGARVLVSTAELSFAIADIYICRKDFYDSNRGWVEKFSAGWLKACNEVVELKKQYEAGGSAKYTALLKLAQNIYGKDVMPSLENDVHGAICDATFVGLPGQVAFFQEEGNLHGFSAIVKASVDVAVVRGYASTRNTWAAADFDYSVPPFSTMLGKVEVKRTEKFRAEAVEKELDALNAGGTLDERTIYSFSVNFKAEQTKFDAEQYGTDFQKVVEVADKYGNAVVNIRGHVDPTKMLYDLVMAGRKKGIIQQSGSKERGYQYSVNGRPLDLTATKMVVELIEKGDFDGVSGVDFDSPKDTYQAGVNISLKRADSFRDAVIAYAAAKGLKIDKSQIQVSGVGCREPFIAKPRNKAEQEQNMRAELRLVRVTAETMKKQDFDF